MADFPVVQLPSGCEETTENSAIRNEMDSGIIQSRPRFTRARRTWEISWDYMNGADYRTLRSFFESVGCGALPFNWTHPAELTVYNVRFKGEIRGRNQSYDYWSVNITLEQV